MADQAGNARRRLRPRPALAARQLATGRTYIIVILVPDVAGRRYVLVAEQAINAAQLQAVERALCANPQYAYARSLGQLRELRALHRPDLRARLAQDTLANGGRLADIKALGLRVHDAARWL